MNTRVKSAAQVVLSLLLLGLIGWGAYLSVAALVSILAEIESNVAVAVVATAGTIVVSVFSLVVSKRIEAKAAVRQELREKKLPIYESIISTLFKVHFAEKIGQKPPTEQELIQFFAKVTERYCQVEAFRADPTPRYRQRRALKPHHLVARFELETST